MSIFLDDAELGPAITSLLSGSKPQCAVAFWGDGASKALFANAGPPKDIKVICDLTMGGSNPKELRNLGAPTNYSLRHIPGLHAKVYLSNMGLITSSANASNNGIGFITAARLIEAGTFHDPDSDAWKAASRWLDAIWHRSSVVDEPALKLAQKTWERKLRGGSTLFASRSPDPKSLLDTVASNPERFRGVGFVFTVESASHEDLSRTVEAVIKQDNARDIQLLEDSDLKKLANWDVKNAFTHWSVSDVYAWPERFICAHRGSRGRISYNFYRRAHTAVLDGNKGMVLAEYQGHLRAALGFKVKAADMAEADAERLKFIFEGTTKALGKMFESGEKLAQLLDYINPMR